jgi:hypothetical protein
MTGTTEHDFTAIRVLTAYSLALMAGCASPDTQESAGAGVPDQRA